MSDFPQAVWALRIALALIKLVTKVVQRGADATKEELEAAKKGALDAHQRWENLNDTDANESEEG